VGPLAHNHYRRTSSTSNRTSNRTISTAPTAAAPTAAAPTDGVGATATAYLSETSFANDPDGIISIDTHRSYPYRLKIAML
jgi:hypothetical protein